MSQVCALETTIRLYWVDHRVKMAFPNLDEYVTLNPKAAERFWIPDIFIDQVLITTKRIWVPQHIHYLLTFFQAKEMRIPTYFVRPASIRIYNNSKIRYATRVNFDVACKMVITNNLITHFIISRMILGFSTLSSRRATFRNREGENIFQRTTVSWFQLWDGKSWRLFYVPGSWRHKRVDDSGFRR